MITQIKNMTDEVLNAFEHAYDTAENCKTFLENLDHTPVIKITQKIFKIKPKLSVEFDDDGSYDFSIFVSLGGKYDMKDGSAMTRAMDQWVKKSVQWKEEIKKACPDWYELYYLHN